ncbi:UvrD-helicase domain-containing protein [Clostridium sp. P21]|uniref:UvrD-helicase domain-containing protein n=1 Tax=Clostridium muellerianum TaxID=2716538 RepID=A0A7Y0EGR5_9CLOT|nr:UvrD-helicase domain-containing protein [Clostridium muellerianum]NMM63096.1 UvrD-helicase domain-containing protein [Clostridium muellerianum]
MEFNREQKEALNIDKNVALSAGAGSGKTRVLTERYLRLLESGIDVAQVVAITFTDKAALEMKNRIREQIVLRVEKGEKTVDWQKALDKLEKANISTIHSFCSNIVKENAALLGMDFNFKIINDVDSKEFLKDTAAEVLKNYFSNEEYSEEVQLLNNLFENKYKEEKFIEEILKIRVDILEKGLAFEEIIKNAAASIEKFVLKIIYEINEIYREYKLKRDMLDYTDLQTRAAELLGMRELREAYKKRYKRIMVDEFQDSATRCVVKSYAA